MAEQTVLQGARGKGGVDLPRLLAGARPATLIVTGLPIARLVRQHSEGARLQGESICGGLPLDVCHLFESRDDLRRHGGGDLGVEPDLSATRLLGELRPLISDLVDRVVLGHSIAAVSAPAAEDDLGRVGAFLVFRADDRDHGQGRAIRRWKIRLAHVRNGTSGETAALLFPSMGSAATSG
ncbi:hypothetical protein ACIHDR_14745 [Nocardia sp. NPDC052278]|uniref:hypothetical protein n=1 Tax=unclassified Nocardia TaxID=2637762 RepID=UPI00369B9465